MVILQRGSLALACLIVAMLLWQPASFADDSKPIDAGELEQLLTALGYESIALDHEAFEVAVGSSERQCYLRTSLSEDKSLLWVFAYMAELGDFDEVSKQALIDLLAANETYGPTYFSIGRDGDTPRWVYLNRAVANRGITAESLRATLEGLCDVVHDSKAVWAVPAQP